MKLLDFKNKRILPAVLILLIALASMFSFSTGVRAFTYENLDQMLAEEQHPDLDQIEQLPSPTTAREYYLRSRVESDLDRALEYLESAIVLAEEKKGEYLLDWVNLVNLRGLENGELEFLNSQLDVLRDNREKTEGELWLTAGLLAREAGDYARSEKWFDLAREFPEVAGPAYLELAELALEGEKLREAEDLLQDYFITFDNDNRPRFWLLQGRLFEEQGADSEAYVTYSHVIQNYPESLLLPEAEERIDDLRLPPALVADVEEDISPDELIDTGEVEPEPDPDPAPGPGPDPAEEVGPHWIQVGSFQGKSRAENFRDEMKQQFNLRAEVVEATVEGQLFYRVQVGGFQSREKAETELQRLESAGQDGWIITR